MLLIFYLKGVILSKVTHCKNHSKYVAGCEDCIKQSRIYRKNLKIRNDDTHYKNGLPKRQGIYSDANWANFNKLGKKLE